MSLAVLLVMVIELIRGGRRAQRQCQGRPRPGDAEVGSGPTDPVVEDRLLAIGEQFPSPVIRKTSREVRCGFKTFFAA